MKRIDLKLFIFLVLFFVGGQGPAQAYTDQLQADPQTIFEVTRELLSSHGFREEDPEALSLETKWIVEIGKRHEFQLPPTPPQASGSLRSGVFFQCVSSKHHPQKEGLSFFQQFPQSIWSPRIKLLGLLLEIHGSLKVPG